MNTLKLQFKHTMIALFTGLSAATAQNDGSDINHAISDTILIQSSGLQLNIFPFYEADSVKWEITNLANQEKDVFLYIDSHTWTPVTVYENATVAVWLKSYGLWYTQLLQFNAVTQNEVNGTLSAPVIANARYQWYFEGEVVFTAGNEYVPTQIGTYKVVILWDNANNVRVDAAGRAEFVFEVTRLSTVTNIDASEMTADAVALYPSIATEEVHVANVKGGFEYSIESPSAGKVLSGTGFETSSIDISSLTEGMYLVKIKANGTEISKKLIVN